MVAPSSHSTLHDNLAPVEDLFINGPTSNAIPHLAGTDDKQNKEEKVLDLSDKEAFSDEDSLERRVREDDEPVVTTGEDVSRFVVSLRDDEETAFTFRSAVLGAALTALAATINQLYYFKPVSVDMSSVFIILISYVLGQVWARSLPTRATAERFPRLKALGPVFHFINPGRLTLKEHAVSSIVATSASNSAAIVQVFAAETLFFNVKQHTATAVLGTLAASLFGYGLCGVLRPICVYPSNLVYWTQLPMVSLYQTFHHDASDNKKRLRLFGYTFALFAFLEPITSYIAPTFNGISVFCLASQKAPSHLRAEFNRMFGGANNNQGLGLFSLSFDWQYITSKYMSLPLIQQANSWVGLTICYLMVIGLYYGNAWGAKSLPLLSTSIFQENGKSWNQSIVFHPSSPILNQTALEDYGLPRMTASYIWANLCQCAAIGALITHVLLFWGKDMVQAWRQARDKTIEDPHYKLMLKYSEVPHWWYLSCLVLGATFGIVSIAVGHTTLTIWGYIVALLLGTVIAPLSCFLYGVMGTGISTNSISKMVSGAILPGRPLANLYFSTYSHEVIVLVVNLSGDLKLGQYLHIPSRTMFLTQVFGTILGAFINYAVMISVVRERRDLLLGQGNNVWSGAAIQGLRTQAVTWSLASSVYSFGPGGYGWVPVGLAFGALLPIFHWLLLKKVKKIGSLPLDKICIPVILQFSSQVTSGVTSTKLSCILVGLVSQGFVRTRYPALFRKYNYILGGAADGGAQVIIFLFSFALLGAAGKAIDFPTWAMNPTGNKDHCAAK